MTSGERTPVSANNRISGNRGSRSDKESSQHTNKPVTAQTHWNLCTLLPFVQASAQLLKHTLLSPSFNFLLDITHCQSEDEVTEHHTIPALPGKLPRKYWKSRFNVTFPIFCLETDHISRKTSAYTIVNWAGRPFHPGPSGKCVAVHDKAR